MRPSPLVSLRPLASIGLASIALVSIVASAVVVVSPGVAHSQDPAGSWYDPASLMSSLRPAFRSEVPSLGLGALDALTLYDLDIELDPERRRYTLTEEIFFTNTTGAALDDVVVRVFANGVPGAPPVSLAGAHCQGQRCTVRVDNPTALTFRPSTPLPPNGRLRMVVRLEGRMQAIDSGRTNLLAQGLEGLTTLGSGEGSGDYGLLSVGDGIASLANFYAVIARRDGQGWVRVDPSTVGDHGSDEVGHVRARLRVPAAISIATTGQVLSSNATGNRREHRIVAGLVRDFSILASADFRSSSRRVGDVEVRSHYLAHERDAGERVLDAAAGALEVFERRFGPYPYADLDLVEAPLVGGAGGVEFAGLVTVASMFYRPSESGLGALSGLLGNRARGSSPTGGADPTETMRRSVLEFVTAHEVAHQYWHGLVGSDSREHPFVDESLAQYSAMLYFEDRYGDERARREGETQVRMNYHVMRLMGMPDAAVDQPVEAFGGTTAYAGLVYGKGPYMYPALRAAVGDRAFFAAIAEYVRRYRFKTAPPRALIDLIATQTPRRQARVRALERRWLEETHGDEDLGEADVGSLLGSMLGGDSSAGGLGGLLSGGRGQSGGADAEQLRRLLEGFLGGGGGGSGATSGPGRSGGRGSGAAPPDHDAVRRMIEQLSPRIRRR